MNLPLMVEVGAMPFGGGDAARTAGRGSIVRRRGIPGSRAMLGGLLVASSAVGLFAVHSASQGSPSSSYLTVSRDVLAGEVLTRADLALVPIDLPAQQRSVSFTDIDRLVGTVALGRMRAGQLVQSADVADVRDAGSRAQISVAVEPSNAMNGDSAFLRGGERVDVIATFTQAGAPVTRTVASDVIVVEVLTGDRSLGTSGQLTVVLSVDPDDLEAIAGAGAAGKVTLARTTGLRR
jgi:Flp pilus assembly protein CpaB